MSTMKVAILVLGLFLVSGVSAQSPDSFVVESGYGLPGDTVSINLYLRNTQFHVAGFSMRIVLMDSSYTNFVAVSRGSAVEDFESFSSVIHYGSCRIVGLANLSGSGAPPLPVGYHEMVRVSVAIDETAPLGSFDSIMFMDDSLPPDRDNSISDSTGYINEIPTLVGGKLTFDVQSSLDDNQLELPLRAELFQNFPNPFNAETRLGFSITEVSGNIKLDIFDLMGREVKSFFWNNLYPGEHYVTWNGKNNKGESLASGVYFYRLILSDSIIDRKRMTLLK